MSHTVGNPQAESLFTSWNIPFRLVEEYRIADIRKEEAAQVRGIAHIAIRENVERYALQMRSGAVFPPVILWNGVLIDGNTRLAAAEQSGRATFPAYVVELPSVQIAKALAATLNNMNGQALTSDEAHASALVMIDLQFTDAQIAAALGVTGERARQWRKMREVAERADRLGLADQLQGLGTRFRLELAKVTHDAPFRELLAAVAGARPELRDVREVVNSVKDASSDQAAVELVAQAREEWTPIGPKPGKHRPNKSAQQARMNIGALLKLDPASVIEPGKAESDRQRWQELAALADRVLELLSQQEAA